MPYSDNLRPLEDGSDDNLDDQLSPSDGYFNSSSSNVAPAVPNVIVPDPTIRESETPAESKARQAKEDSFKVLNIPGQRVQPRALDRISSSSSDWNTAASSTRPSYTPSTTTHTSPTSHAASQAASSAAPYHTRQYQEPIRTRPPAGRTPSIYAEAPPAYTPSPATPLSPASQGQQATNYSTFSPNMGVENDRLLGRDPESMGGSPGDDHVQTPRWSRRFRRRLPSWFTGRVAIMVAILFIFSIGFLTSSTKVFGGENRNTIKPQKPSEEVKRPPETAPEEPAQPGSPDKQPLQPSFCRNATYRFSDQIMAVDFGKGKNLTVVQNSHARGGTKVVKVGGQINMRQLDEGGYPRVVIEILTNYHELLLDSLIDEKEQTMKISVPKKFKSKSLDDEDPPCVEMRATIWVPQDAELQQLVLGAVHLDILTLEDLSLRVADYVRISAIAGNVISAATTPLTYGDDGSTLDLDSNPDFTFIPAKQSYKMDSRVIEIASTTGNIKGNWPLYDMLGLHSTSGNIKVSITPKPVLDSDPKPAVLSMSSISGSIHATEPIHELDQIPIRDYLVDTKSTSGGIHCALAFGAGVELKSTASDIAVDLLPVMDQDKIKPTSPAQLETTTTSGTTAVRILDPIWYTGQNLTSTTLASDLMMSSMSSSAPEFDCLQAMHKSTSADVGLRYPQTWIGDIESETTSGKLSVKGKDVIITRAGGSWPGNKLLAYKGQSGHGSTIIVKSMLGNMDAILGDE